MAREKFDFEGLVVFQRALDLLEAADELRGHFRGPREVIGRHLFEAVCSVVLNLAESSGRSSRLDRARFLDIANGSAREAAGALAGADRLGIGPPALRLRIRQLLLEIVAMLTRMTRNLRSRGPGPTSSLTRPRPGTHRIRLDSEP